MDDARFDAWTRRRFGLATAGALAAVVRLVQREDTGAKRKKKCKKKCKKRCKAGKAKCGGACFDLQTDRGNCGSCGTVCGNDEVCQGGSCVASILCPPNQTRCDGQCVNTLDDPAHCGACGHPCAVGGICRDGTCCRSPGETCVSGSQCCALTCGHIEEEKPTGQDCSSGVADRCCLDGPATCLDTCECCGALICHNQRCCVASGQLCRNDNQCCGLTCGPVGEGPTCF